MSEIPRIYADFNGLGRWLEDGDRWTIPLDTLGSVTGLNRAGSRLRDGLRLTVYADSDQDEDLEADAEALWVPGQVVWMAVLVDRWRYVRRQEWPPLDDVPCLGCRAALPSRSDASGAPVAQCPACGTSLTACIAPPDDEPAAG